MRGSGQVQLALVERRDHFQKTTLVHLVAAAELGAEPLSLEPHRGIVGPT